MKFFDPVAKANEIVAIETVLTMAGVELNEGNRGKIHCPFGYMYHSDGGLEATVRVYSETNSARCFRCNTSYSPVWLGVMMWGGTSKEVAWKLLELSGFKLPTFEELWTEYTTPKIEIPDTTMLAMALKTYCARVCPSWTIKQFDTDVSSMLSKCLSALNVVLSEEDAEKWLEICKKVMIKVLGDSSES